ncbi:unnamed protein product [Ectocarpus sp. CCAP 1310/34]|nr:unnamed protein product [Ectocarpus sp. CCAP 1310/34]
MDALEADTKAQAEELKELREERRYYTFQCIFSYNYNRPGPHRRG